MLRYVQPFKYAIQNTLGYADCRIAPLSFPCWLLQNQDARLLLKKAPDGLDAQVQNFGYLGRCIVALGRPGRFRRRVRMHFVHHALPWKLSTSSCFDTGLPELGSQFGHPWRPVATRGQLLLHPPHVYPPPAADLDGRYEVLGRTTAFIRCEAAVITDSGSRGG
jgi:hypothetical protein